MKDLDSPQSINNNKALPFIHKNFIGIKCMTNLFIQMNGKLIFPPSKVVSFIKFSPGSSTGYLYTYTLWVIHYNWHKYVG